MPEKNIIALGFDVGSKKFGVAVGQSLTLQAKALDLLQADKGLPTAQAVQKLITTWKPQYLVVGVPLTSDGKEQFTTVLAKKFIIFLQEITTLPIIEIDERYTTKQARSELFEEGGFRYLTKSNVDSYAAKLMIECWFRERFTKII